MAYHPNVALLTASPFEHKALLDELRAQEIPYERRNQQEITFHQFQIAASGGGAVDCRIYQPSAGATTKHVLLGGSPNWVFALSAFKEDPYEDEYGNSVFVASQVVVGFAVGLSMSKISTLIGSLYAEGLLDEALGDVELHQSSLHQNELGSSEFRVMEELAQAGAVASVVGAVKDQDRAGIQRAVRVVLRVLQEFPATEEPELSQTSKQRPLPTVPSSLSRITIGNFRAFESFQLDAITSSAGQWTLLLGDNGVGKTTILRSIALALIDQQSANSLLQLGDPSAPFLRNSEEEGRIAVTLNDQTREARIALNGRGEQLSSSAPATDFPIYAYGCQRGTALGGPKRDVEFRAIDDIRSLFDVNTYLIHAETWLRDLYTAALEAPESADKEYFDAVCQTAEAILNGVEKLEVDKDGVWLTGEKVGVRVPLASLSDGYVTTAGWLFDLIARWSKRCRDLGIELKGDFCEHMTAFVLIDEIDLHLHPLWQTEVVAMIRKQFPRLSVVATTHNPLTLLGAQKGEIHVLRRDPGSGLVDARQVDIRPGTRADDVLTGEWFGLSSTVDHETRDMLAEHRGMLRDGVPADDPKRRDLEGVLRKRLGVYASTAEDRIAESVAAELIPGDYEELTPQERKRIRSKILKLAQQRATEQPG